MTISISRTIIFLAACVLFCTPLITFAQSRGQVISVTPPLFQISVAPGDLWQSTIRVVNGNAYELPIYAELVNFAPEGENGQGRFIPLIDDDTSSTLADWIEINSGPYVVPPEQSMDIPFFIEVPENAPPGGHFAAVLVGTQPPDNGGERLIVQTSQAITSLFFLRIEGDIVENGSIREFKVEDTFVSLPEASFVLRFENKGNVHLQPRGDIIITNMWGKERGIIPINHQTHFGNVLPNSIREFKFTWSGVSSLADIGRYKAIVTLAYGEDGIKSDYQATYFWVIPVKATLITLSLLIAFILFMVWVIRLYIRKTLALAGVDVDRVSPGVDTYEEYEEDEEEGAVIEYKPKEQSVRLTSYRDMSAPLRRGASDLRARLREVTEFFDVFKTIVVFIINYKLFFGTVLICILAFVFLVYYVSTVSEEQRSFEVTINQDGIERVVDSEEIIKDRLEGNKSTATDLEQLFVFEIVNASGKPGLAAETAIGLEKEGYHVRTLTTSETEQESTTLYYDASLEAEAVAVGEILGEIDALVLVENKRDLVEEKPVMELQLGADRVLE